jgi:hypothetical protein
MWKTLPKNMKLLFGDFTDLAPLFGWSDSGNQWGGSRRDMNGKTMCASGFSAKAQLPMLGVTRLRERSTVRAGLFAQLSFPR